MSTAYQTEGGNVSQIHSDGAAIVTFLSLAFRARYSHKKHVEIRDGRRFAVIGMDDLHGHDMPYRMNDFAPTIPGRWPMGSPRPGTVVIAAVIVIGLGLDTGFLTQVSAASTTSLEQGLLERLHPAADARQHKPVVAMSDAPVPSGGTVMTAAPKPLVLPLRTIYRLWMGRRPGRTRRR
ncbi:hypothetical protein [Acidisphaera sp. S103]|uniref:hypothetical protein n=1 Tax=Acidisphaera sp. S103 TaxID=1747223 RepID=UPI00131D6687|nr:hypothetical protein [Acidisphaera sp. S103]